MYKLRNATIWCGGPVPGGEFCPPCMDEMPPAWQVSGNIVNGDCDECTTLDGAICGFNTETYDESGDCDWKSTYGPDSLPPTMCEGDLREIVIYFRDATLYGNGTADEVAVYCDIAPVGNYEKILAPGEDCNKAHTLSLVEPEGGTDCGEPPDEITITPSA